MTHSTALSRRRAIGGAAALGALAALAPLAARAQVPAVATKPIKAGGEQVPLIGLGTWITFNVGNDTAARDSCADVMGAFFAHGGRMIDSSPMYGSSEAVIGHGLRKLGMPRQVFAATKVWTASGAAGPGQMEESRRLWGVEKFDLLQVHNVLAWEQHLKTLRRMKEEGRVRLIGITTSHGMRHETVERIMLREPIDVVQITYNPVDRAIERRILPLAAEKGIAVIANRPFREGALIDEVMKHKLPGFAAETGCANWAQFLLKFTVSHPAVTCAIPATSRVDHAIENMGAALGPMPDAAMRRRMAEYVQGL
jgi:diketogulonate reductase-like aldo/keto reductase